MNMLGWLHSRPAALVALAFDGLLVAWTTTLGWGFVGQTFPGFLVMDPPHTVALSLEDWPGTRAGLTPYERLGAVDGRSMANAAEVLANLRALVEPVGGTIAWHNTATGAVFEVALPLVY